MAYKSSKGDREFGDLKNEDDTDTQIDWGSDSITFKTNNTARFIIQNSQLSGSEQCTLGSNVLISGDQYCGGALNVSGNVILGNAASDITTVTGRLTASQGLSVNVDGYPIMLGAGEDLNIKHDGNSKITNTSGHLIFDNEATTKDIRFVLASDSANTEGVKIRNNSNSNVWACDAAGNVSGSGTLQAVGNTFIGGTLNVSGAVTLGGPASGSVAGPGSYLGVDSNGLLVLDTPEGSGGGGGISWDGSTANGVATFKDADEATVEANLTFDGSTLGITGNLTATTTISGSGGFSAGGGLQATGDISGSGALYMNGAANLNNGLSVLGSITSTTTLSGSGGISAGGGLQTTGNISGSGTLAINGGSAFNSDITILGNISGSGTIRAGNGLQTTGNISGSGELNINDDASFNEDVTILGSLRAKQLSVTYHGYNTTATGERWVPVYAMGDLPLGSADETVQFAAAFAGRLVQVVFRPANSQAGGDTRISLYKATNGAANMASVSDRIACEEVINTNSPSANANSAIYNFSASAGTHFNAGDVVGITIDPQNNPGDINVTCIWEYDMFGV